MLLKVGTPIQAINTVRGRIFTGILTEVNQEDLNNPYIVHLDGPGNLYAYFPRKADNTDGIFDGIFFEVFFNQQIV